MCSHRSGDSMRDTCNKLYEPEDVTVGAVVGKHTSSVDVEAVDM